MSNLGFLACLLASSFSSCAPVQSEPLAKPAPAPAAFITSERVVYGLTQPVDVTFSVSVPASGSLLPGFRIENAEGETVAAKQVRGRYLWEASGKAIDGQERRGAIAAKPEGGQFTETIANLREWYELDGAMGLYAVTFDGQWIDENRKSHPVTSNTIRIALTGPAGELEPGGEPLQPREIPLSEIWALDMPGTRPMNMAMSRETEFVSEEGKYLTDILRALERDSSAWGTTLFPVHGLGIDALREAHAVIVKRRQIPNNFVKDEAMSICFISKPSAGMVHLRNARDYFAIVEVPYERVPVEGMRMSWHIALIPFEPRSHEAIRLETRPVLHRDLSAFIAQFMRFDVPQSTLIRFN